MKKLTIFTPTYNRAYCLNQCYQSLINQTNQNFIWLIIDDGSTDNTDTLVKSWIQENKIEIHYYFQNNQGMHGAHNTAYKLIKTELNVCIDSDDFMPKNAVKEILTFWSKNNSHEDIAGFVGLDAYKNGQIIGRQFPLELQKSTLEDLYFKYNIYGDKKIVYRTEIVKKYKHYPIFPEERFVPLGTLYLSIDKDYQLLCFNEIICVVEYMEDGSSRNIIKQYKKHPNGFRYSRIHAMKYSNYFKVRLKSAIHYVSHSILLKDWKFINKSPKPFLTAMVLPLGVILYAYINFKTRNR